jgi:hypothetical protein
MKYATGGRASKNTKSKIAEVAEEMQNKRKMRRLVRSPARSPMSLEEATRLGAPMASAMPLEGVRRMPPMTPLPRPRGRQLTPEEATRMERLRDEFHGKTQMGTTQLKKGGKVKKGYHKMPDGKIMKNSAHKKTAKCTRGDGCAKKGKTKGRMV